MKKVLFGLFALSTVALAAETNLYLRAGVDFNSKFDTIDYYNREISGEDADGTGYEISAEVTKEIAPNLEIGLGIVYQDHNKPDSTKIQYDTDYGKNKGEMTFQAPDFKSIPLYLTAKYTIPVEGIFKPYVKADFGYSFNNCDDIEIDYIEYDNNGKIEYQDTDDVITTKIDNGIYYGIGAGIEYENFVAELMYKVNTADIEVNDFDDNGEPFKVSKSYDYSRITLSFGYKFNF